MNLMATGVVGVPGFPCVGDWREHAETENTLAIVTCVLTFLRYTAIRRRTKMPIMITRLR